LSHDDVMVTLSLPLWAYEGTSTRRDKHSRSLCVAYTWFAAQSDR